MMLLPQAEKTNKKSAAAAAKTAAAKPNAVFTAKPRDQSPRVCYSLGSVVILNYGLYI